MGDIVRIDESLLGVIAEMEDEAEKERLVQVILAAKKRHPACGRPSRAFDTKNR
jgi:DNA invertase Pin-like site-specific DNA recombinase